MKSRLVTSHLPLCNQPLCSPENSNCTPQNTEIFRTTMPRYPTTLINYQLLDFYPTAPCRYLTPDSHRHPKWRPGYLTPQNYPPLHQLISNL